MIKALAGGRIDAIAKGGIGNGADAQAHGGAFGLTALDTRAETGGCSAGGGGRGAGGVS